MNEDELARKLEHELEAASPEQATPPYNLPPEVRKRLEMAADLAQVDFSQGSPLRPALRAQMAEKARRTLPGAHRRAQIARWMQPALAGAGLVALALLLIFGISLISRGRLPIPAAPATLTASPTPYPPPATATATPPAVPTLTPSPLPPTAAFTPTAGLASDEKHLVLPSGLRVEEFALTGAPELDPLKFTLRSGEPGSVGGSPGIFFLPSARLSPPASEIDTQGRRIVKAGQDLSAVLYEVSRTTNLDGSVYLKEAVQVMKGDQVIYTTQPSDASPIDPLRGLWTYGDYHWVLEYARVDNAAGPDNSISSNVTGQIVLDGELLNETRGYQEAFGFQLLNGKPFYFFQRDGQIGVAFGDDEETLLGYEQIPHYQCCSGAEENPRLYAGGVTFFATRGGTNFYVAIGVNPAPTDAEQAQLTVSQFLADLAGGQDDAALYDAAAQLYGGPWADLEKQYPDANGDRFTLFQKACAPDGYYNCLKVRTLSPAEKLAEDRYRLWAQFSNADGSLWHAGDTGQSWFDFEVVRGQGGQWKVMDPPPISQGWRQIAAHLSAAETAGLDGSGILRALWEDYMQRFQFTLLDDGMRLVEFEIVSVNEDARLDALRLEQGLDLIGGVEYSVRPVAGAGAWIAGNGEMQGDWVRNKFMIIGAIQDSDAVHLKIIGTGP